MTIFYTDILARKYYLQYISTNMQINISSKKISIEPNFFYTNVGEN